MITRARLASYVTPPRRLGKSSLLAHSGYPSTSLGKPVIVARSVSELLGEASPKITRAAMDEVDVRAEEVQRTEVKMQQVARLGW